MSGFPGAIFDADGNGLDPRVPVLTQEIVAAHPYMAAVVRDDAAKPSLVWVLKASATFRTIPLRFRAEATARLLAGEAVMILASRSEVERDVRAGLLDALDFAAAVTSAGGHA